MRIMAQYILRGKILFTIGAVLFLLMALYLPTATASIVFELQLNYYNGDTNKADDTCCDPRQDSIILCDSLCDPGFQICLDDGSFTCPYFDATTGQIEENVRDITFATDLVGVLPNPIEVTIDKWPDAGLRINITAEDYDGLDEKEKIDNYFSIITDIPSFSIPTILRGKSEKTGKTRLNIEFSARCSEGYEGEDCQTNTDECQSDPCLNGATCNDLINGYNCTCTSSFEGTHCDGEVDECENEPCQNGATCYDFRNGFNCTCTSGYTGSLCQEEIDECTSTPCQNGATCYDYLDGFNCTCTSGYAGSLCQEEIDECTSTPCQNGATCYDYVDGFNCACSSGYEGSYCEGYVNECVNHPCLNGGTCTDLSPGFQCTCLPGYTDEYCSSDIDECYFDNSCPDNSVCENTVGSFSCLCLEGYEGERCAVISDPCVSSPCQRGTCDTLSSEAYSCICEDGFLGVNCELVNPCTSTPCLNGGECESYNAGLWTCQCVNGYGGELCEFDLDSHSYDIYLYGSFIDEESFTEDMEAVFTEAYGENVTVFIVETSNYYTPDTGDEIVGVTVVVYMNGTALTSDEIHDAIQEEELNDKESFEFYFGEVVGDKPNQQKKWLAEHWYVVVIAVIVGIVLLLSTTIAVAHLVVKRSLRKIQYENNKRMFEEAEKQARVEDDERYIKAAWVLRSQSLRSSQYFSEEHIYKSNPVYMTHEYESMHDDNSDNYPYVADYL